MRHRIASILFFAIFASLALACEAVSHANDFGTASAVQTCGTGTLFCNGTCIAEDQQNCGSCGASCEPTQVCSNGQCGSQCTGGTTLCSGHCVDTKTDPKNCGRCGGPPDAGACPFCQSGKCVSQCTAPQQNCGGSCIDVTSDSNNCGTCGHECPASRPLCNKGSCDVTCGALQACNSGCTDTNLDPNNCGGCDTGGTQHKCPSPLDPESGDAVCVNGNCEIACNQGLAYCATVTPEGSVPSCVDTASDFLNCGFCGHRCTSGTNPVCSGGVCSN